jgi:2-oxo-3-hexenedioate decarboxylase
MNFDDIANEAFAILGTGRQIAPFASCVPGFGLAEAYQVTATIRRLREARGERVVGRKIGFTNRTIWAEYNVHAPIWGYMYDTSVHDLPPGGAEVSLSNFAEPRIEPEIVFGLRAPPKPDMDARALIGCIGWVAHGFEIVQSIFPNWTFLAADTVAAYGLHGGLWIGPRHALADKPLEWERALTRFEIDLFRNGGLADHGRAANVLDGPVFALSHLVKLLAADAVNPPLATGEIITTGTVTRAFPMAPGDVWSTALTGIPLGGARLHAR